MVCWTWPKEVSIFLVCWTWPNPQNYKYSHRGLAFVGQNIKTTSTCNEVLHWYAGYGPNTKATNIRNKVSVFVMLDMAQTPKLQVFAMRSQSFCMLGIAQTQKLQNIRKEVSQFCLDVPLYNFELGCALNILETTTHTTIHDG